MAFIFYKNWAYRYAFENACLSSETAELTELIVRGRFEVDELMDAASDGRPLARAISYRNTTIINLLLDYGARTDITSGKSTRSTILVEAVDTADPNLVKCFLDRGANADLTVNGFQVLRSSLSNTMEDEQDRSTVSDHKGVLELLIKRIASLSGGPEFDNQQQKVIKFARLCDAIFQNNQPRVIELLAFGDYTNYAGFFENPTYRPAVLAVDYAETKILKAFVDAGVDLQRIYFEAAKIGNIEVLELVLSRPGFNPFVRSHYYSKTALHEACSFGQIEVVKLLVKKYGLRFDARDRDGKTPLYNVHAARMISEILAVLPEIPVNTAWTRNVTSCKAVAVLLEHGVDPAILYDQTHLCDYYKCDLLQFFEKFVLILEVLGIEKECKTKLIKNLPVKKQYKEEVISMQNLRISNGTMFIRGKSLLDFILLNPNEAARYSRNTIILDIYNENKEDFKNVYPHYGSALNIQLRKSQVRRLRLESALELLCSAFGTGLPEIFAELIFGTFSNNTIGSFSLLKASD